MTSLLMKADKKMRKIKVMKPLKKRKKKEDKGNAAMTYKEDKEMA